MSNGSSIVAIGICISITLSQYAMYDAIRYQIKAGYSKPKTLLKVKCAYWYKLQVVLTTPCPHSVFPKELPNVAELQMAHNKC